MTSKRSIPHKVKEAIARTSKERSHLGAVPTSPGEILQEEFLEPMNVTAYRLAKEVHIPQSRISDIISGKRGITADTAMRFAKYFGTTPQFWLNIQNQYDLDMLKVSGKVVDMSDIRPYNLMQG